MHAYTHTHIHGTHGNMDESQMYYVKWRELVTKGYILNHFIYMTFWKGQSFGGRDQMGDLQGWDSMRESGKLELSEYWLWWQLYESMHVLDCKPKRVKSSVDKFQNKLEKVNCQWCTEHHTSSTKLYIIITFA
jgi:hypothetical protein